MCKIFLVAGIKPTTADKVWRFAQAIGKPMSKQNTDGLGYGAITAKGDLFGERWLSNDHAFKNKNEADATDLNYEGAVDIKKETFEYNSYGTIDKQNTVAITMHTRWATSPKGMMNTHPFVLDGVSLIHNGVIRNYEEFKDLRSTCDSEAILHAYVQQKVWESPTHFQAAADMLRGYYACGVLVNTEIGPLLDIFKAHHASLYVTYVEQLETWVHCTSDDDIKNTCRDLGYNHGPMYSILPGKFIRVNALTGKTIKILGFTPGFDYYNNYSHPNTSGTYQSQSGKSGMKVGSADTTGTKFLGTRTEGINRDNVLPYGKKKENTKISSELLDYYNSGRMTCTALSEREIQEEIMNNERIAGRY